MIIRISNKLHCNGQTIYANVSNHLRQHLSNEDYEEDKREDYQSCSLLCYVYNSYTQLESPSRCRTPSVQRQPTTDNLASPTVVVLIIV